ncbi:MAG: hypothetical protein AAGF49_06700 [Pseudomonadota bacterium]
MSPSAHKSWLKVAAVVIGSFGPIFLLSTIPGLTGPARLTLDILAWPIDGFPSYSSDEIRFLSAITGGVLVGWAATVWCLSAWVYDAAPEAVRKSLLTGACAWFVVDSAGSVTSGNPSNTLFNVVILLLVVGPMWRPARLDPAHAG